jgi:hypothetical protein
MPNQKYRDRLQNALIRDEATLVGEHEKIIGETSVDFKCKCGNVHTKTVRNICIKGGAFCEACGEKKAKEKAIATNQKVRGVDFPQQSPAVRDLTIQKSREKFGTDNPFQSQYAKDKSKETNQMKRGVDYPQQDKDVLAKRLNTTLNIYGHVMAIHNPDIQAQIRMNHLSNHGVEFPTQREEIKVKITATNQERYGGNPMQNAEIQAKARATMLAKHGFEHALQNPYIMARQQESSFDFKDYRMPSGAVRKIQGYEHFALKELLMGYTEEQIKTGRVDVPRIMYLDNGKDKYHYPDIFIPHENRLIEVKSTKTFEWHRDEVLLKKKCSEDQGFRYEIWCFDNKGNRVELAD